MQYFDLFFDNNLIDYITNETNRYASQVLRGRASTSTADKSQHWRDVTVPEMRVFFALNMLQSIVRKPEIVHYWSRRPILSTPFFGDTMSYRRFTKIRQYLHFVDNDIFDPLTHPNPKLNKMNITIDESLLLYKGRLGWYQYMPQRGLDLELKLSCCVNRRVVTCGRR
ncbi:hypothetical protein J437_LFUL008035 [Ladona fulva]|uniref:PiggyBac transposable element-derived protein domain-containing protein n=1 Tax=Ladona fulva TaxID=123851 RepID=A0A8K0KFA2_LADFU|nr:hypothetical protein J437_LFUL008035 [Ladona fulva]